MENLERWWLDYAKSILLADGSHCQCSTSKWDRFPGYMGENYERGGVLLVGSIHHAKGGDLLPLYTDEIRRLQPLSMAWASGEANITDTEYLASMRRAYRASFSQWRQWSEDGRTKIGTVWNFFHRIRDGLGLPWDHIAFTNLAKCYLPSGDSNLGRIIEHQRSHPLHVLVNKLKPTAVFIAADNRDINAAVALSSDPTRLIRRFNNRNGTSNGARISEWLRDDAKRFRHVAT